MFADLLHDYDILSCSSETIDFAYFNCGNVLEICDLLIIELPLFYSVVLS